MYTLKQREVPIWIWVLLKFKSQWVYTSRKQPWLVSENNGVSGYLTRTNQIPPDQTQQKSVVHMAEISKDNQSLKKQLISKRPTVPRTLATYNVRDHIKDMMLNAENSQDKSKWEPHIKTNHLNHLLKRWAHEIFT